MKNSTLNVVIGAFVFLTVMANLPMSAQAQQDNPARPRLKVGAAKAGEYIIKMKFADSAQLGAQKIAAQKAATEKGVRILAAMGKDISIQKTFASNGMIHMKSNVQSKIDFLKNHPDVEFVEPNYLLSIDPTAVDAMGVAPQSTDTYTQSYSSVQATEAWRIEKPYDHATAKTVVAVIDSGVDLTHGVIANSNSIWINEAEANGKPGVDDDGNGYIDDVRGWNFVARSPSVYDDNGHGTHVAGIVLGVGMDVLQSQVRESRTKIMALKFLDGSGSGSTADAIAAIDYAVRNGARVINNSWGGPSYSQALNNAYANAYNNGVLLVSAAGNNGQSLDTNPMYPAAFDTPSNITVAATSDSDTKASFSNFSQTAAHVAAPGVSIISTVPGTGCSAPGCFQMMSGTSMAAPFVAGLAALIIREAPQLSGYQVKGIILGQVDVKPVLSTRVQSSGRVNVLKSIQSAINNQGVAAWSPSYSVNVQRSIASESAASQNAAGCGLVKAISSGGNSGDGSGLFGDAQSMSVLFLVLLPFAVGFALRQRAQYRSARTVGRVKEQVADRGSEQVADRDYKRQYDRFKIAKDIVIKTGDHVIEASSDSLSVGGLSFNQDTNLEKGQKIKVQIAEMNEEIEAEIVWCAQSKSFGVKFLNITEALQNQMRMWTAGLTPT